MKTGTVIVLNGTSSSGKTSIVKALQEQLEEPFLDVGIDRFIWMLPGRYLNQPLWDEVLGKATQAGPVGHRLIAGMHRAAAALARVGNAVIVDHVLVEPDWVRDCAATLAELPAYLVGVFCPLAVLEAREKGRKDRTLGQARAQFPLVHAGLVYDLVVDTSVDDPAGCAAQIAARLERGGPRALRALRDGRPAGENLAVIG